MSVVLRTWRLMAAVVVALALTWWPTFRAAIAQTASPDSIPAEAAAIDDGPPLVTTDQVLTLQIQDQLQKDRRCRRSEVVVDTHDGVVTLVGSVPSAYALSAALDMVHKTPGVVGVDSYLRLLSNSPQAPAPP